MPRSKNFDQRKIKLNGYLRNTMHPLTLDEMVERLIDDLGLATLQKRTVQNDIKYLKKEYNAPVKTKKIGAKIVWFYDDAGFSVDKLPVDQEELNVLQAALDIITALKTFKLSENLQALVVKLKQEGKIASNPEQHVIQFETNEFTQGLKYIEPLLEAIKGGTVIEITYQKFVAEKKRAFIIHPYLLKEYRNRWYVLGLLDSRNEIATFALDRLIKIKPLSNTYQANTFFNPREYFNNLIGISRNKGDQPESIILKVARAQVPYFETQFLHHTQQKIRDNDDGSAFFQYNLIVNFEFKQLLLSYTGTAEVIEPEKLKEELREAFKMAF